MNGSFECGWNPDESPWNPMKSYGKSHKLSPSYIQVLFIEFHRIIHGFLANYTSFFQWHEHGPRFRTKIPHSDFARKTLRRPRPPPSPQTWLVGIWHTGIYCIWLVVTGTMEWIMTFQILGIITPTDFHSIIFQRGRSTTNQIMWVKQCHKPSPSHHHFYRWYGYHSQMRGLSHCFTPH